MLTVKLKRSRCDQLSTFDVIMIINTMNTYTTYNIF